MNTWRNRTEIYSLTSGENTQGISISEFIGAYVRSSVAIGKYLSTSGAVCHCETYKNPLDVFICKAVYSDVLFESEPFCFSPSV